MREAKVIKLKQQDVEIARHQVSLVLRCNFCFALLWILFCTYCMSMCVYYEVHQQTRMCAYVSVHGWLQRSEEGLSQILWSWSSRQAVLWVVGTEFGSFGKAASLTTELPLQSLIWMF